MKFKLFFILIILILNALPAVSAARNNLTCGIKAGVKLTNGYGPYDATNPAYRKNVRIVTKAHFTPNVERLISGKTASIIVDIDYTLRAIPNYHRALYAVAKYQRLKPKLRHKYYSAECYFKRAIYFQPKDDISRMLYGMHLHLTGKYNQAKNIYQQALILRPDGAELNYNYGLLLIDMKQFKLAKQAAAIAYNKGYPLQGLKKKLASH